MSDLARSGCIGARAPVGRRGARIMFSGCCVLEGLMSISRHRLGFAAVLVLALLGTGFAAHAQQVLVMVNGDPVTTFDVSQRQRMAQMLDRKTLSHKAALDEVIDERLKIQQARLLRREMDQEDLDRIFNGIAQRSGRTPEQLEASLKQAGLEPRTFKRKLAADYIWNSYVRARAGSANVRDADVAAALQQRGVTQNVATEYVLRPIIFVVPRNARNHGARLQEANSLRSRFRGCETGLQMARGMKEVVVRPQALRMSSDMPAELQKVLDKTPVGQLTPPEVTQSGVETFAICEKRQVRGESSAQREMKNELSEAQFKKVSNELIQELRRSALIKYN